MKIESLIVEIIQVSKELIISPREFWAKQKEEGVKNSVATRVYLLTIIFTSIADFLGELFWSKSFLWSYAIGSSLRTMVSYIVFWFIAGFLIKKLAENYGAKTEKGVISSTLAYAMLPTLIISVIVNLIPGLYPLNVLGLYSLYLFYEGVASCFNLPKENLSRYVLLASLLIILVSGVVYTVTWSIFKNVFSYGI